MYACCISKVVAFMYAIMYLMSSNKFFTGAKQNMSSYYSNSLRRGAGVGDLIPKKPSKLVSFLSLAIQVVTLIILIVVVIKVSKTTESFGARGISYIDGQMLYADVPEKVNAGGEEYDNPLYKEMIRRWEPTDTQVNGYTVWKPRTITFGSSEPSEVPVETAAASESFRRRRVVK